MKVSHTSFLSALLLGTALCSQAADVVFTFDFGDNGQSTITKTVSGITLTLSNSNGDGGLFSADSSGIILSDDSSLGATSFQLSFSSNVQVVGYNIGEVFNPTTGVFNLTGTGGSTVANDITTVGDHTINGTFVAQANDTITLVSNVSGTPGLSQIKSFTVTPVPEPGETAVIGAALCTAAGFIIRRQRSK